jgi:hypothetical protein
MEVPPAVELNPSESAISPTAPDAARAGEKPDEIFAARLAKCLTNETPRFIALSMALSAAPPQPDPQQVSRDGRNSKDNNNPIDQTADGLNAIPELNLQPLLFLLAAVVPAQAPPPGLTHLAADDVAPLESTGTFEQTSGPRSLPAGKTYENSPQTDGMTPGASQSVNSPAGPTVGVAGLGLGASGAA